MPPPPADLDHIRVRFATFREHPAEERARIAADMALAEAGERVLLDTCHRVELITVARSDGPGDGAVVRGRAAVRRVFEVVAGFDSAVMAEEQVLGQARAAYESALAAGATGPILNELLRRALRFGRLVRTHARPGSDRSLADRGVAWLVERLPQGGRVAVIGTGEMGRRVAMRLAELGHAVTVLSGSAERGGRLLESLTGSGHSLSVGDVDGAAIRGVDAIAMAVRPRAPVLTLEMLEGNPMPWVLDLSSPGALGDTAAGRLGERLLSVDALGAVAGATPVLEARAERRLRAELATEVDAFVAWMETRRGADALATLHREAEAIRRRHIDRLQRRARLDPEQLAAVDAASTALVGELLQRPTLELRRHGGDAQVVRRLFGLRGSGVDT
ncbi:MAG TPA: NAD(P)-binding domain-containing protein [Candidatus Limnocylindria bacterium]